VIASDEFRDQPRNIESCREKLAAMLASVEKPAGEPAPHETDAGLEGTAPGWEETGIGNQGRTPCQVLTENQTPAGISTYPTR
jgi:hypothetical protein